MTGSEKLLARFKRLKSQGRRPELTYQDILYSLPDYDPLSVDMILSSMIKAGLIKKDGSRLVPVWRLV